MIDNLMRVFALKSFVGEQGISVEGRASFDVFSDFRLQFFFLAAGNHAGMNLPAALKNSHDCGFVFGASSGDPAFAFADMHVPRFAADESFVRFHFGAGATHLHEGLGLYCKANTVHHEPRRFLSDAEVAPDFVTADAVLAIDQEPYGGEPFFQRKRRILKNRADLERELLAWVWTVAAVYLGVLEVCHLVRSTLGTADLAIGPTDGDHELATVFEVAEELDGLLEGFWAFGDPYKGR